ncbi:hypothetical protein Bbelb_243020 [Branchiostoma belcheri]|nr:hypothetical protein Bbelb_243020 [Branchiostoma belcheri]
MASRRSKTLARFYVLLLALVVTMGAVKTTEDHCPEVCDCTPDVGGQDVSCIGYNLKTIPEGLPEDTVQLNLRNNDIEILDLESIKALSRLEGLDVSSNKIKTIRGTFEDFPKLMQLQLYDNELTTLSPNTFGKAATRMNYVSLFDNPWNCDCNLHDTEPVGSPPYAPLLTAEANQDVRVENVEINQHPPIPVQQHEIENHDQQQNNDNDLVIPVRARDEGMAYAPNDPDIETTPTFSLLGCVPTTSTITLEWRFQHGRQPDTCELYDGKVWTNRTIQQDHEGRWRTFIDNVKPDTEFSFQVRGIFGGQQGRISEPMTLQTPLTDNLQKECEEGCTARQFLKDFCILGDKTYANWMEKLCKTLEGTWALTGWLLERDAEPGTFKLDNLDYQKKYCKKLILVFGESSDQTTCQRRQQNLVDKFLLLEQGAVMYDRHRKEKSVIKGEVLSCPTGIPGATRCTTQPTRMLSRMPAGTKKLKAKADDVQEKWAQKANASNARDRVSEAVEKEGKIVLRALGPMEDEEVAKKSLLLLAMSILHHTSSRLWARFHLPTNGVHKKEGSSDNYQQGPVPSQRKQRVLAAHQSNTDPDRRDPETSHVTTTEMPQPVNI